MSASFREPSIEILKRWIDSNCHDADSAEVVRAVVDSVQTQVGNELLRNLPHTRAYHANAGELKANELLASGAVMNLIRRAAGMADEPGQPTERESRRRGLMGRIERGEQ